MEIPKWIPKKIIEESEGLGGIDVDDSDIEEKISCDKGNHKIRSIFNSPVHNKHWKKEEHDTNKQSNQSEGKT